MTNTAENSTDFIYVELDCHKLPYWFTDQLKDMMEVIYETVGLDVWSLDVALDNNNKLWCLEINSCTGLGAIKLALVYKYIYEDYYNEQLPDEFLNELKLDIIIPELTQQWNKYQEYIIKSEWAIDYEYIATKKFNLAQLLLSESEKFKSNYMKKTKTTQKINENRSSTTIFIDGTPEAKKLEKLYDKAKKGTYYPISDAIQMLIDEED